MKSLALFIVLAKLLALPIFTTGATCGIESFSACVICTTRPEYAAVYNCTAQENNYILNVYKQNIERVYTNRGLPIPNVFAGVGRRSLQGGLGDQESFESSERDVASQEVLRGANKSGQRQLAKVKCADLCKASASYCQYYSCNSGRRLLSGGVAEIADAAVSAAAFLEGDSQQVMGGEATTDESVSLVEDALDREIMEIQRQLLTNTECWDFIYYELFLDLLNATRTSFVTTTSTSNNKISSSCRLFRRATGCKFVILPTTSTAGCCSLDKKNCAYGCGNSPEVCGGCYPSAGFTWLTDMTQSTCRGPSDSCDASKPCCWGLQCSNSACATCQVPRQMCSFLTNGTNAWDDCCPGSKCNLDPATGRQMCVPVKGW